MTNYFCMALSKILVCECLVWVIMASSILIVHKGINFCIINERVNKR